MRKIMRKRMRKIIGAQKNAQQNAQNNVERNLQNHAQIMRKHDCKQTILRTNQANSKACLPHVQA